MIKYSNAPQAKESKNMITDSLIELLKKYKYADLTISKICEKAKISRITFYRNFEEKDDIIKYYLQQINFNFNYDKDIKDINNLLITFYNYILNYKDFLLILNKNNLIYLFKENVYKVMENFDLSTFNIYKDTNIKEYAFDFIASTICSVLTLWAKHNFKENTEYIAYVTNKFLLGITKNV